MGWGVSGVVGLQSIVDIDKWCGHSSDKGTLQMTEHSQRCGYSLKSSRQGPRMKPCRQVPRANPTDHTSLPMYVWGTFNSGFPKLRYGVKSHFFDSGTLQMTGHSQRCEYSSHYLAP